MSEPGEERELFEVEAVPMLPEEMTWTLRQPDAPTLVAALQLVVGIAEITRPPGLEPAGGGCVGDGTRLLFGVEFNNVARVPLAQLAGLRKDGPPIPPGEDIDREAVRRERLKLARQLYRRWDAVGEFLKILIVNEGRVG